MKVCLGCGSPLTGKRRLYCSDRCQGRASNTRFRAAHLEEDRERSRQRRLADPERHKARSREWYHANKDRHHALRRKFAAANPNIHVLYQHGVTPAELAELYRIQRGLCAICDQPGPMRGPGCLVIDHDHATGTRRGLICGECNKALPVMERVGPTWALRALAYVADPPLPRMRRSNAS